MSSRRIIYFLLTAYLVAVFLLIFIQYYSSKNINALIQGNQKLINEFSVAGELKELERDIISVESRIRGTVNTEDTTFLVGIDLQMAGIETKMKDLRRISGNDSSMYYMSELDMFVGRKLQYSRHILKTYFSSGKMAAEEAIATQIGKRLTDSIQLHVKNIGRSRQNYLSAVTSTINASGKNALRFSIVLVAGVLLAGAFVFWYIINIIRRQNSLIYQLNISEKKVKEAASVKENFLANMSHEIRTPMNAILGFTNLLQRKKELDSESKQFVQTIQGSAENLLTIINDILDLSKIEAGMMRIEPAPFSIRGLVHSLETMFRSNVAKKNLKLTTVVDESLPDTLEGDAVRLTQILVNLVGNAIKFTAVGSVTIKVFNEGRAGEKVNLGMTVSDTGIGIDKEKLQTIFERFQQAEASVTRKYGGTGLGLAIVRDLVQLQNGTITVESEPGKGTTFHFMIPYKVSTLALEQAKLVEKSEMAEPQLSGVRILIVEDNEVNQTLIQTIFSRWNVKCKVANNGLEALQILGSKKFDLILMDIQMPEMDGYTATQKIRNSLNLSIPIIAMTAHAMAGEREKCLSYGMNEYISKPVREEHLYKLIAQFAPSVREEEQSNFLRNPNASDGFQLINLEYMREVSAGDAEYEKIVTEQFLELLPPDLALLKESWEKKDLSTLRRVAHNMKTTISVMGLNDLLNPYLGTLEYEELTEESFEQNFTTLKDVSELAMQEARTFYQSLGA